MLCDVLNDEERFPAQIIIDRYTIQGKSSQYLKTHDCLLNITVLFLSQHNTNSLQ